MPTRTALLDLMAETMRHHFAQEEQAIATYQIDCGRQAGEELAWHSAAQDWWQFHFRTWKQTLWEQAVTEALAFEHALAA